MRTTSAPSPISWAISTCRSTARPSLWPWWSAAWKNTSWRKSPACITVKPKQIVEIGPFKIEFIHVTHSIVSAVALAITTPLGVIIHTGDFKVDPTPTDNELFDLHTLADYGKRGVLLLLSDSTNSDRPGYTESERAVRPRMEEIFNRAERRVVVSCFSSSIHRIQLVLDLAQECGRRVAVIGRSMVSVTEIAHSLGLLDIPDGILLRPQDAMGVAADKVTFLISGTQGEPMSALSRVAVDNHKHVSVEKGDTVVLSSRIIPGNEKAIFRMIDHMARRGADVLYGSMNPPLHVSGHASVEEMKLVLNLVRPRYFMPIHGEFRQLSKHARLAEHLRFAGLEESFIMESGEILEIDHHGARKAGKVPVGHVCIDSGSVDDVVQDMVIRDRRHLSEDGIVLPIIAINRNSGRMESLPEIVSRGFNAGDGVGVHRESPPVRGQNSGRLESGGEDRLGRHEGKDPRGPEALHREGDVAASADHAGDSGSIAARYLEDASGFRGSAARLIVPADEAGIAAALREASAAGVPVTVAGGGTGVTGGGVPLGGWVLSVEKLNRLEIHPGFAIAGAGVPLRDLQAAAQRTGQFYPPDPTENSAFLGGTISTNASGSRSFRFGATRRWVKCLRVVLADGRRLDLRRGDALDFDPGTDSAARCHQEHRRLPLAAGDGLA